MRKLAFAHIYLKHNTLIYKLAKHRSVIVLAIKLAQHHTHVVPGTRRRSANSTINRKLNYKLMQTKLPWVNESGYLGTSNEYVPSGIHRYFFSQSLACLGSSGLLSQW